MPRTPPLPSCLLQATRPSPAAPPVTTAPAVMPAPIEVSGSCQSLLNDVFERVARTADGRWYFLGQTNGMYLHFDSDCNGGGFCCIPGARRSVFERIEQEAVVLIEETRLTQPKSDA